MCLLLAPVLIGFFSFLFAAAINSTNEANKQAVHAIKQSITLMSMVRLHNFSHCGQNMGGVYNPISNCLYAMHLRSFK
jgi:hypothetical protein